VLVSRQVGQHRVQADVLVPFRGIFPARKSGSVSTVGSRGNTQLTQTVGRFFRSLFCFAEPGIFEDGFAFLWFENEKEIDMRFIKKLFSTEEPFVPTPSQSIPGLDPMGVQA
ncbi:MAG: hypothetical protein KBF91_06455, partial [Alphaproteobacteria bacterium]|nr:hypothetical protein [Alphaproteobacteria bacterium]